MNLESIRSTQHSPGVVEVESHPDYPTLISVPNRPIQSQLIRALDLILTTVALVVLLPLFVIIACAIKFESQGPVLFVQKRVGRYGNVFNLYKFRSMVVNAEAQRSILEEKNERGNVVFKMREDPRITRIGRIIRRCSLDELPQLLNILKGEMSLVGPRPALPVEVDKYEPRDRQRLLITPGLTGLWQVSGRASISFEEMIELDLKYIQHRSVWLNAKIIVLTVPAVLSAKGAY